MNTRDFLFFLLCKDCGQVKHITLEQRIELAKLILAIARKDKEAVVKQYCAMGKAHIMHLLYHNIIGINKKTNSRTRS